MAYLLDTHVVAWLIAEPERLPDDVLEVFADPVQDLLVSSISAYEVAQKVRLGKWNEARQLADDWTDLVESVGLQSLSVDARDAQTAGQLDWEHRDPFDRIIATQAMLWGHQLVSADRVFSSLRGVQLLSLA
ncbi:type II toxin-antitoxin system VapC family toxin [Actinomyces qiguomingii]|uniref:type II toxin-antitoxin system VapC family toxin n=1 Tax=Actinomyces qiguomingii TaxID=2057800 RepID=UPI000CA03616|nr:type II toxin-antitoxin system VapC family toxin [Actinomyces qiguomingii]